MRCSAVLARIATAAALSAPNIRVAEVPKLADRIEVTTTPSPIGHTEAIHFVPSGDIFVDDDALIASQVTATRSRMISEDATFFHRAGPRREVVFEQNEAKACIVTCGGVCPWLEHGRAGELYLCLAKQYGVQTVYGVQNGYSGFKNWQRDAVKMDSKFVYEIQRKGGTVLRSSRGGHDTAKICDALEAHDVNMLFVIGGDGTMKGACKIDAEMSKRGKEMRRLLCTQNDRQRRPAPVSKFKGPSIWGLSRVGVASARSTRPVRQRDVVSRVWASPRAAAPRSRDANDSQS